MHGVNRLGPLLKRAAAQFGLAIEGIQEFAQGAIERLTPALDPPGDFAQGDGSLPHPHQVCGSAVPSSFSLEKISSRPNWVFGSMMWRG